VSVHSFNFSEKKKSLNGSEKTQPLTKQKEKLDLNDQKTIEKKSTASIEAVPSSRIKRNKRNKVSNEITTE